jgi:hypothetical protein
MIPARLNAAYVGWGQLAKHGRYKKTGEQIAG